LLVKELTTGGRPDGGYLTEPLDPGKEGLLYADIKLEDIDYSKALADPVGH
jgi:hypothetical protein